MTGSRTQVTVKMSPIDLNKEYYRMKPFLLLRMSEAHYLINLQLYQTIDGRRNREQIWGSFA